MLGEGVIVINRCCSFHKTMSKAMIKQLPPQEYAALLCETVKRYKYPAVTYDFANDQYYNKATHKYYPFNKKNKNPHKNILQCKGSMLYVEQYIRKLLQSTKPQNVKNGLANVLYWGYANQKGRRKDRVIQFIGTKSAELDPKIDEFVTLVQASLIKGKIPTGKGAEILKEIAKLKLPQFGKGMSFVSKILMFLDPEHYPVLDSKIAKTYANQPSFPPLENLTLYMTITSNNACTYETWACWCRKIADEVNRIPKFPCYNNRAVDVERALFALAGSLTTKDCIRRAQILAGPK